MFKDEYRKLYAGVLAVCGVALASSVFFTRPEIKPAVIRPDTIDYGAIETASTTKTAGPDGAEAWNYPEIPWRSFKDGMEKAAQEKKPAILVLQASWCLMCRDYQQLFKSPEVKEWADDYVFILADIDKEPDLQKRFNVDGDYIPRTFIMEHDGKLRIGAQGGFGGHKYFVDPYRPQALLKLLKSQASAR
ncbi:MAG: thioredoxin family protein [Neomegalonema sp.]|nr:thioredoxin family protein [Neomegalonema sp.]